MPVHDGTSYRLHSEAGCSSDGCRHVRASCLFDAVRRSAALQALRGEIEDGSVIDAADAVLREHLDAGDTQGRMSAAFGPVT